MVNHKVSLRYASSLLESSIEKGTLETVAAEAETIYKSITGSSELTRVLSNPVIKSEVKASIISEIFKNQIGADLLHFLRFIIGKRREDQLINILGRFLLLKDEHLGIVNIQVNTAFDFTAEQTEALRRKFEKKLNKKVRLNFNIDKNLIGGFVAKVDDTVYDASVKHQLELLKKEFLSGRTPLN